MNDPIIAHRHDSVVELRLNRPKAYNALDYELLESFLSRLAEATFDKSVRGVVISAEGKAFCAGGDLRWASSQPTGAPAALHKLAGCFHQSVLEIRRMPKPVIAAIDGVAAGGGFSLALACDFRVMSESAVLIQAYTSSGLSMDGSGTYALPRLVGLAKALEIAAFDEPISAGKALEWGLVTRTAPPGHALEEALFMARQLAQKALHSFGWSKRLLTDSFQTPFETQMELERKGIADCAAQPDGEEGVRAFLEKRKPEFGRS
ncbi:MAG: enoyl-CoA hydratase/isomerase family protein [Deltaproteobacteria bacterium]|nr:enoyl-CoA hydratase/isomerase family protein [Deltaproteobacteria bacterium]